MTRSFMKIGRNSKFGMQTQIATLITCTKSHCDWRIYIPSLILRIRVSEPPPPPPPPPSKLKLKMPYLKTSEMCREFFLGGEQRVQTKKNGFFNEWSDKLGDNFFFALLKNSWNVQEYYFRQWKTFSIKKIDFPWHLIDFQGANVGLQWHVPSWKWKICDVISPEIELSMSQNLVCGLKLSFLLPYQISLWVKMVRNKKFTNFDNWWLFLLPFDGNETLYSHRTWEYIAKMEVESFAIVIVSMVTVW